MTAGCHEQCVELNRSSTFRSINLIKMNVSKEYRAAADYRCQLCKVDCRGEQGLLQLHHRDGDTSNNAHHNLAVLCVDCHARQAYHGQMGRSASDQARIAQIRKLRRQQNLTLTPETTEPEG